MTFALALLLALSITIAVCLLLAEPDYSRHHRPERNA